MIEVGSRWYVWGKHQTVRRVRKTQSGQEVLLVPDGFKGRIQRLPWVEARILEKYGRPSSP